MDVVYTYTDTGSAIELKYSIRSMVKHLNGLARIFIVGDHPPAGLGGFIHIPLANNSSKNKALNIYQRIRAACMHPEMGKEFIYASDDHFLLQDFEADRLPCYYSKDLFQTLAGVSPRNYYRKHVEVTYNELKARGLPTKNFNVHFPVVFNAQLFVEKLEQYDWTIKNGYLCKSLFLNTMLIEGSQISDCKIHTPKTKTAIYRRITGSPFFSTCENSMNANMLEVLHELYPDKSPFEV